MALTGMAAWIIGAAAIAGGAAAGGVVLYTSGPLANDSGSAPGSETLADAPFGSVTTLAGVPSLDPSGAPKVPVDGVALQAVLGDPNALAVGPGGEVYFADFANRRIGLLKDGLVRTFAGSGAEGIEDGDPQVASFTGPAGIAVRSDGTVAVSDSPAHRIRLIGLDGRVTTLAGSGPMGLGSGAFVDGKASDARFNLPAGLAFDAKGNLLVADKDNHRIRMVAPDGTVSTFAGTGQEGSRDGERLEATFAFPVGLAVTADGNVYVTEHGNNDVRRITADGIVETAYRSDRPGAAEGSAGGSGALAYPSGIAVLADGSLLIANVQANTLLVIGGDGSLIQVIGTGDPGHADGPVAAAKLARPSGVAAGHGLVVVADTGSGTIRTLEVTQ